MPVKSATSSKSTKKSTTARVSKNKLSQSALAKAALKAKSASKAVEKPAAKQKTIIVKPVAEKVVRPKKAKAPKTKGALTREQVKELLDFMMQKLDDGKAENIVSIDLVGKTSFADYLIIASGTSVRHIFGLANNLALDLKKAGFKVQLSGENGDGNWVVIDAIDIVVHLFTPQTREDYDIESLWEKNDKK